MISASSLQRVKLKPTDVAARSDRSAPNPSLCADQEPKEKEESRRQYFFDTGMDRWYSSLKDTTFRTEFLELTPEEARAIVKCWTESFQYQPSDRPDPDESRVAVPPALRGLSERIQQTITVLATDSPSHCVFVKLSTRSPKDSLIGFARARQVFKSKRPSLGDASINDKLILLAEAVIEGLKVRSGDDAIKLLITSDRVGEDLGYALEPGDEGFGKRISLVIREWVEIPLWAEFRGFVWNGNLTSIGQYNHPVTFPRLKDRAGVIKTDLAAFYERIKDRIPLDRYIIDFAWTEERVYLIEVNPFDGELVFPASTGLWSWETDREAMMNGPLELRIREDEVSPQVLKNSIEPKWREIVFS